MHVWWEGQETAICGHSDRFSVATPETAELSKRHCNGKWHRRSNYSVIFIFIFIFFKYSMYRFRVSFCVVVAVAVPWLMVCCSAFRFLLVLQAGQYCGQKSHMSGVALIIHNLALISTFSASWHNIYRKNTSLITMFLFYNKDECNWKSFTV